MNGKSLHQKMLEQVSPDIDKTAAFINKYSPIDMVDEIFFENWASAKEALFKAFGEKLTVEQDVSFNLGEMGTEALMVRHYESLYPFWSFGVKWGAIEKKMATYGNKSIHPFIYEAIEFANLYLAKSPKEEGFFFSALDACLGGNTIQKNRVLNSMVTNYTFNDKEYSIPLGMKPMRALRKVLAVYGEEHFPSFDSFRTQLAQLKSEASFEGKLVFSIHPLDYLTMSDNSSGWSSCMSWRAQGNPRGIMSMVNSQNTVVAYLKSSKDMTLIDSTWNSKVWRVLVTLTPYFLLVGHGYPYSNLELNKIVLDSALTIVKENMGWTYQQGPEIYQDMNEDAWIEDRYYIYTENFYNDFEGEIVEEDDEYEDHWYSHYDGGLCCKNPLPDNRRSMDIFIEGDIFCLGCGKKIPFGEEVTTGVIAYNFCLSCWDD